MDASCFSSPLQLNYEELREVQRCCLWVVVKRWPPSFDLQRYLVGRLSSRNPTLAARIEGFDQEEMRVLCEEIVETQQLACWALDVAV
jgi:hypothetical protein